MAHIAIKVENLYKQYRLGLVSTGTLSHDLNRWWHQVRGKEDPYEKLTGENTRAVKDSSEYVWALQDINFSVKQGEVLGIIGKNGAGKSTLLKILSKVTGPTKGNIKVKGRIASLLEVGTGFHPELTGRENVFLNGAILGMTKTEIRSKFDEIVAFSGVEKYIDTPVKRYSSGMYVRLAFAVAAHLEPEILIVDEVLAVGDAEFQKKCLGKMKDVSSEGRTVLFVSHNMAAVRSLCTSGLYMANGTVNYAGEIDQVIDKYLLTSEAASTVELNHVENQVVVQSIAINDNGSPGSFNIEDDLQVEIKIEAQKQFELAHLNLYFNAMEGGNIFVTQSHKSKLDTGSATYTCTIPGNTLNDNYYSLDLMVINQGPEMLTYLQDVLKIQGIESKPRDGAWMGKYPGLIRPKYFAWTKN